MRGLWLLGTVLGVWLLASPLAAQTRIQLPPRAMEQAAPRRRPDPGAFARGAAVYGVVSAGLLLGSAIAMAARPDAEGERITRGVWVGALTLSVPFVALGGWTARHRADVEGFKKLRVLGWTSWTFGLVNGVLQWYEAFQDETQPWGLTVGLGAVGVISLLPVALDAFASGRRASMRSKFGIAAGPGGLAITF